MNRNDIAYEVSLTLGDYVSDFDIELIVDDLIAAYGSEIDSIDDYDSESFWAIVESRQTSRRNLIA